MEGVGRQNWARGRIPIFRKIHLYAFLVKSTHGHTKKKPTQPFFRNLAFFGLPRQRAYPGPTLDLPWSAEGPTLERPLPYKGAQPGAGPRKHLPWTYPGPTLEPLPYAGRTHVHAPICAFPPLSQFPPTTATNFTYP
jgi:hypothetical protein